MGPGGDGTNLLAVVIALLQSDCLQIMLTPQITKRLPTTMPGRVGVRHASLEQKAMFLAQVSAKHPQPVELEFEKAIPLGRALLRD